MECYGAAKTDERLVAACNKFCEEVETISPAPRDFIPKDVTVKQEKIDPKYDNLDKNSNPVAETEEKNEENSQAHEEEVAEGDTEETKDAAAENAPKKSRKNAKKKPSVAPAVRRTLRSTKSNV